jgi:hypothetical protein
MALFVEIIEWILFCLKDVALINDERSCSWKASTLT